MRIGKLTDEQLESLVLSRLPKLSSNTLSGAGIGADCAWLKTGENLLVTSSDPITAGGSEALLITLLTMLDQGAEKLILDVRNNPGGYKHELCEILDYLLPEGPLFRSEYYDGTEKVDESDPEYLDVPMAVLVNAESISAAEFFAAALDEYEAATVVGEQTIGKGYFQQAYELSDGSAVGLSVGKYTTPNGVSLTNVGLTPDVVVEVDEELFWQIYYGNVEWNEDPQILAAIAALQAK